MKLPHEVLGVGATAGDEEIRAAYLNKVKEFPPDRNPEEFEAIRDAYQQLRDPRERIRRELFSREPGLAELVAAAKRQRQYAGPHFWKETLKAR